MNFAWDGRDAVAIGMEQIIGVNRQSAHMHRHVNLRDVDVAVRTVGAAGEHGKADFLHLVQIPACPAGDEPLRTEHLVHGAHDLSKCRGNRRAVKVLKDDNRGAIKFLKSRNLFIQAGVGISPARRS